MNVTETVFAVNDYQLAALEWNRGAPQKIMALHGWLDNAASFSRLAPLLAHCHVIALDLAGHGHSDHRPVQATYNLWDDLTDILAVADAANWDRFHLLGHSRGGMVSLLLATSMPERIESLSIIDALVPEPVTHADTSTQLGKFLHDSRRQRSRQHTGYDSIEKAITVRCKAIGMLEECARPIVERALRQVEGRYYWRSDPRLRNASAVKMTDEHNRAILRSLNVPLLLAVSEKGVGAWDYFNTLIRDFPGIEPVRFTGSHHFHLENDAVSLAERVLEFLQKDS